jgi:ArsR family transcriptional regulator, arsenate/arsenite/antimonite-responsive transcriptional repressor
MDIEPLPPGCCTPVLAGALEEDEADRLAQAFRVLSDPARLRLLSLIAVQPDGVCACELAEPIGKSQPTLSHHLKVLHDAGLLERERIGRFHWYRVVPDRLADLRGALAPAPVAEPF